MLLNFALTNNFPLLTAPSPMRQPVGAAISQTQIELGWTEPTHFNGALQPYQVICYGAAPGSPPVNASTVDAMTTYITVSNLRPNTFYQCLVIASTKAAAEQDPAECKRYSKLSARIRTLGAGALALWSYFLPPLPA